MKKTTLFTLLTMMLLFVGNNVWADEEPFYTLWTVSQTGEGVANHTDYNKYFDDEHDGMIWNAPGNQKVSNDKTDRWRIGGKDLTNVDRTITAKSPMGSAINRVVINHFGISRAQVTVNSIGLMVASDADFTDVIDSYGIIEDFSVGQAGSVTLEPSQVTEWPTGAYYKLIFNISNSSTSNGGLDLASIQFFAPGGGSTVTVAKPVIEPNGGTFTEPVDVTITAGEGCDIIYTTDGSEPGFSAGSRYTEPFTVSESCTVKAVAIDVTGAYSAVASAEFKFSTSSVITSIKELCAADQGEVTVQFNDWVCTGLRGKNNVNVLFTDGENDILLYQSDHGFKVGDHLRGTATINLTAYKGAPEITGLTATTEGVTVTAGEVPAPTITTIGALDNTKQGCIVKLEDVTYNATDKVLNDATGASIAYYDGFSTGFNPEDGKTYDATGIVLWYDKLQIAPRTTDDFVAAGTIVTVAKPVITPNGGSFTEPLEVTIAAAEGCSIYYTTDGTDPGVTPVATGIFGTLYEEPFTISEDCVVKAVAIDATGAQSDIATAEFKFISDFAVPSIGRLCPLAPAEGDVDVLVEFNNWIVTGVKGNQVYFTDGPNGIVNYKKDHGFEVGDVVNGKAIVTLTTYLECAEITSLTKDTEGITVTKGEGATPISVAIADLYKDMQGCLLTFKGITYDGTAFVDDDDNTIKPSNKFVALPELLEGKTYNVTGVAVWYVPTGASGHWEIAPRTVEEFELITDKQTPESSWSVEKEVVDIYGEVTAFFTTNSDGAVTYSSSDESVATVDENGFIRPVGRGVTEITANVAETDTYLADSQSFTLTVTMDGYTEATFAFSDKDIQGQGTSGGGSGFSATRNDVLTLSFTNAYGAAQHIKVYGNATNDIEKSNVELSVADGYAISKIVFTITGDQDYRSIWVDQFGVEAAYDTDSVHVTWSGIQNKVVLNNLYNTRTLRPKQARIKTIDVTYIKLEDTGRTVTIGPSGVATYCAPEFTVISKDGEWAEVGAVPGFTGANANIIMVDTLGTVAPAKYGLLIMGEPGEYKVYRHVELDAVQPDENLLSGVFEDMQAYVGTYVMDEEADVLSFKRVKEGDDVTIEAGHAYLRSNGTAAVDAFFFNEEDYQTGIRSMYSEQTTGEAIYNLAGQRLSKMQKGVNVVGGKKILK